MSRGQARGMAQMKKKRDRNIAMEVVCQRTASV